MKSFQIASLFFWVQIFLLAQPTTSLSSMEKWNPLKRSKSCSPQAKTTEYVPRLHRANSSSNINKKIGERRSRSKNKKTISDQEFYEKVEKELKRLKDPQKKRRWSCENPIEKGITEKKFKKIFKTASLRAACGSSACQRYRKLSSLATEIGHTHKPELTKKELLEKNKNAIAKSLGKGPIKQVPGQDLSVLLFMKNKIEIQDPNSLDFKKKITINDHSPAGKLVILFCTDPEKVSRLCRERLKERKEKKNERLFL